MMRLNRTAVATVLSLALALGACGKSAPPASEFPAEGEPAKVKLLEAGAADKSALRWKPVKGATGGVAPDLATSFQVDAAGQSMPMTMNMKMDMLATVLDVTADGSASMESEIVSADLDMPGMGGGGEATRMANE